MVSPTVRLLAALVAAALAATGCSGGSRASTAAPTASPERQLPYAGAPAVREPMSLGKLGGDPCTEALTPGQVAEAVGAPVQGKRGDLAPIGPACTWFNRDTLGAVGVSYSLNTHDGLSAVYANTQPQSSTWRVLPDVRGFPAVAHSSSPPTTFCQASVGLRDDTSIDVSLTLGPSKQGKADACDLIRVIADMTVTTLLTHPG